MSLEGVGQSPLQSKVSNGSFDLMYLCNTWWYYSQNVFFSRQTKPWCQTKCWNIFFMLHVLARLLSCWNGFHSGESIFKLLQQLRPRRAILVRGSQQSLNSLRDFCSEVLLPFTNHDGALSFFPVQPLHGCFWCKRQADGNGKTRNLGILFWSQVEDYSYNVIIFPWNWKTPAPNIWCNNFAFRPGGGGGKQYFRAKEWRVGGCHHRKVYLSGNMDTSWIDELSIAPFHAFVHLFV